MNRTQILGTLLLALVGCTTEASKDSHGTGKPGTNGNGGAATDARFFLQPSEPDNTSAPTLAIDAEGAIHAVFPAYAGGRAYYAYCAADCGGTGDVKVVRLGTDASVHDAMIALDGAGHPRVLLATDHDVTYASCDADCTSDTGWKASVVLDHGGARAVSGKAFALDANGRPRFLMHTPKAYLGVGQKAPETYWVACDAGCGEATNWTASKIADEIWRSSQLIVDADGKARLGTVMTVGRSPNSSGKEMAAYAECARNCGEPSSWRAITMMQAFESELEATSMPPAISIALTKAGGVRAVFLGRNDETLHRNLAFFECDADCTNDHWTGSILAETDELGPGLDLKLEANDRPRFVHTLGYNITLAWCDDASCGAPDAKWSLTKVENGADMKPDEIFLYPNCNVSAWFLHDPSLVLTADGRPRVGYQARDISGGLSHPDKKKPQCVAGTDMTWSRLAMMPSAK